MGVREKGEGRGNSQGSRKPADDIMAGPKAFRDRDQGPGKDAQPGRGPGTI